MEWEFGFSRCEVVYIEQINNKVLLHSIGKYNRYPVINHKGKEYEKECMSITKSLGCTAEINTNL